MGAGLLAVYVSGHGFGHATRTAEVLRAVRGRAPDLPITVCTSAPASLFTDVVAPPVAVRLLECDAGLAQRDALTIDEEASAAAAARFQAGFVELAAAEAAWLREAGARVVLGDVPPLAFAAAAEAAVPSFALSNFSWDWIYRHIGRRQPELAAAAEQAALAYGRAGLLLRLPFAGDLSAFPRIEDVPLVARRPALTRPEARLRLGLDARRAVLISFGGLAMPGVDSSALGLLPEYQFLLTERAGDGGATNLRWIASESLRAAGLRYLDLIGAVDVVVGKPGYGTVTDCIGAGTRLVYTARGDFPEYEALVAEMPRYLPATFVSNEDLRTGRLRDALERVRAVDFPEPPRLDGASAAADRILSAL
jgi:L-arabinokinase